MIRYGKRFSADAAYPLVQSLEGAETSIAAVRKSAVGQITAEQTEWRIKGVENIPKQIFRLHEYICSNTNAKRFISDFATMRLGEFVARSPGLQVARS